MATFLNYFVLVCGSLAAASWLPASQRQFARSSVRSPGLRSIEPPTRVTTVFDTTGCDRVATATLSGRR